MKLKSYNQLKAIRLWSGVAIILTYLSEYFIQKNISNVFSIIALAWYFIVLGYFEKKSGVEIKTDEVSIANERKAGQVTMFLVVVLVLLAAKVFNTDASGIAHIPYYLIRASVFMLLALYDGLYLLFERDGMNGAA